MMVILEHVDTDVGSYHGYVRLHTSIKCFGAEFVAKTHGTKFSLISLSFFPLNQSPILCCSFILWYTPHPRISSCALTGSSGCVFSFFSLFQFGDFCLHGPISCISLLKLSLLPTLSQLTTSIIGRMLLSVVWAICRHILHNFIM